MAGARLSPSFAGKWRIHFWCEFKKSWLFKEVLAGCLNRLTHASRTAFIAESQNNTSGLWSCSGCSLKYPLFGDSTPKSVALCVAHLWISIPLNIRLSEQFICKRIWKPWVTCLGQSLWKYEDEKQPLHKSCSLASSPYFFILFSSICSGKSPIDQFVGGSFLWTFRLKSAMPAQLSGPAGFLSVLLFCLRQYIWHWVCLLNLLVVYQLHLLSCKYDYYWNNCGLSMIEQQ